MGITNGERKSVCSIFWLRKFRQVQKGLDHPLHLVFARLAMADNSELGFFRSKFLHRNSATGCYKKSHPFGHTELDCALRVFQHKLRFDRDGIGLELFAKRFNALK